jgi:hypothetical protein
MPLTGTYRWGATSSLAPNSTSGSSTAVFGTQTRQIRVATTQPTWLLIDQSPSSTAATIYGTGALLPANTVDYITVTPGQRLSAASSTASTANLTITEVG